MPTASDARPTPDQLEAHRAALTAHCYRMLGSLGEAEDAVQESYVRAWRKLDRWEGRGSLRSWLYTIATRVCLDALACRSRRELPIALGAPGRHDGPLPEPWAADRWVEPIPDALAIPVDADPAEQIGVRQSIRLAFVAALQRLPPRQRAALLLREVLDLSAAEIAGVLETTIPAVNSALQRARATLGHEPPPAQPLDAPHAALLERYVAAFERYDVEALVGLMHEDATLSMPPYALWLRGPAEIRGWFLGHGSGCRGSRLLPTRACGAPAFGQYRPAPGGGHAPWALVLLDLRDGGIAGMCSFLDTQALFPRFGLPPALPPG